MDHLIVSLEELPDTLLDGYVCLTNPGLTIVRSFCLVLLR